MSKLYALHGAGLTIWCPPSLDLCQELRCPGERRAYGHGHGRTRNCQRSNARAVDSTELRFRETICGMCAVVVLFEFPLHWHSFSRTRLYLEGSFPHRSKRAKFLPPPRPCSIGCWPANWLGWLLSRVFMRRFAAVGVHWCSFVNSVTWNRLLARIRAGLFGAASLV